MPQTIEDALMQVFDRVPLDTVPAVLELIEAWEKYKPAAIQATIAELEKRRRDATQATALVPGNAPALQLVAGLHLGAVTDELRRAYTIAGFEKELSQTNA